MDTAFALLLGRWSSQALAAAIATGILDAVAEGADTIDTIATKTAINPGTGKRLVRAMYALKILNETADGKYTLTPSGELFTSSHSASLKNAMLWEHCDVLVNAWNMLPQAILTGKQSILPAQLGVSGLWEALNKDSRLKNLFDSAMTSFSKNDNSQVLAAYDWENSGIEKLVDIGGGQGYLISAIIKKAPKITGYVYELPETVQKVPAEPNINYVAGDMFTGTNLPTSDAYILKHILHDWEDEKCLKILQVAQKAAKDKAKLFIAETILPELGEEAHPFGFLLDLVEEMMIATTGRERTLKDYSKLFEASGWKLVTVHKPKGHLHLIEAVKV